MLVLGRSDLRNLLNRWAPFVSPLKPVNPSYAIYIMIRRKAGTGP
jgi:hypothetical protein